MKRIALFIALVLFALALPMVFAAKDSMAVAGNETAANYTTLYISVAQLNSTINSNQYVWYKATINISCNYTQDIQASSATLTDLNYTLGDEWANATGTAYITLTNGTAADSTAIDQAANNTYSDGTYRKAYFNLTGKGVIVTNSTNTTWYITYRIAKVDDKKSVSASNVDIHYIENVTYKGPSDLDVANVTLLYTPVKNEDLDSIVGVQYDGTVMTNYTYDGTYVRYDPTLAADSTHYLWVKYRIPETGHGGTGAGATPPLGVIPPITIPGMPLMIMVMGIALVVILLIAIVYLSRR